MTRWTNGITASCFLDLFPIEYMVWWLQFKAFGKACTFCSTIKDNLGRIDCTYATGCNTRG